MTCHLTSERQPAAQSQVRMVSPENITGRKLSHATLCKWYHFCEPPFPALKKNVPIDLTPWAATRQKEKKVWKGFIKNNTYNTYIRVYIYYIHMYIYIYYIIFTSDCGLAPWLPFLWAVRTLHSKNIWTIWKQKNSYSFWGKFTPKWLLIVPGRTFSA